jgi:PadR family transcriptional regulator PadR
MTRDNFELSLLEQRTLLAIMRLKDSAYGISIQNCLLETTGKEYSVGSIYSALDRLEDDGFVKSRTGEATKERGGKKKQYFSLTGEGVCALDAAMNSWDALRGTAAWQGVFA